MPASSSSKNFQYPKVGRPYAFSVWARKVSTWRQFLRSDRRQLRFRVEVVGWSSEYFASMSLPKSKMPGAEYPKPVKTSLESMSGCATTSMERKPHPLYRRLVTAENDSHERHQASTAYVPIMPNSNNLRQAFECYDLSHMIAHSFERVRIEIFWDIRASIAE